MEDNRPQVTSHFNMLYTVNIDDYDDDVVVELVRYILLPYTKRGLKDGRYRYLRYHVYLLLSYE